MVKEYCGKKHLFENMCQEIIALYNNTCCNCLSNKMLLSCIICVLRIIPRHTKARTLLECLIIYCWNFHSNKFFLGCITYLHEHVQNNLRVISSHFNLISFQNCPNLVRTAHTVSI